MASFSPLLDAPFLTSFARQIRSARERLALRTAGNLPGITELVFALRLYIARCDRQRIEGQFSDGTTAQEHTSTHDSPPVQKLVHYLSLADAAYYQSDSDLRERLRPIRALMPLMRVDMAGKWAPGYYVVRSERYDTLVLAIRGSKETSDLVTNLSADAEPFLGGVGHQGIVRSAQRLHDKLRPELGRMLRRFRPSGGLVVVGHSLGGAVAAALTMLLRTTEMDREFEEGDEGEDIRTVFREATCFSFCPPPCLSRELARRSKRMGIVTVVMGYDVVSRLSAASLDRLLVKVSRYNWGLDIGNSVGDAAGNVARGFLTEERARMLSETVREHGVTGITLASSAIARTAQAALDNPGQTARSPLWSLALNATVFVGTLVSGSLEGSHRRNLMDERRRPNNSFARHFGMSEDDIDRVLGEDMPQDVFLAGTVYHIDRPFTRPEARGDGEFPRSKLLRRNCEYFADVEASVWMVHDHHPDVVFKALEDIEV